MPTAPPPPLQKGFHQSYFLRFFICHKDAQKNIHLVNSLLILRFYFGCILISPGLTCTWSSLVQNSLYIRYHYPQVGLTFTLLPELMHLVAFVTVTGKAARVVNTRRIIITVIKKFFTFVNLLTD